MINMAPLYNFVLLSIVFFNTALGEELIELSCVDAQQCKQFEQPNINVTCVDGHCRCAQANTTNFVKCAPMDIKISNLIGGFCPCHLPQSECNEEENICYCLQGYIASADKRRCFLENVALGGKCETDKQCHFSDYYAVCDQNKKICVCQKNYISNNGTCVSIADPTFSCQNDSGCHILGSNVVCLRDAQKCICAEGFVKANDRTECLPLGSYQENCTEHQQCQKYLGPGGFCLAGSCECNDNYYVLKNQTDLEDNDEAFKVTCARIIEIGEYCREDKDCNQRESPNQKQTMNCRFGECNCKWGYVSINNIECVKGNNAVAWHPIQMGIFFAAIIAFGL